MKSKNAFLALIIVQALHSIEEYVFQLWVTFPPARFLTGLVAADLEAGFIAINASVVALGFCCYWWPVRRHWGSAAPIAWLCVVFRRKYPIVTTEKMNVPTTAVTTDKAFCRRVPSNRMWV